MLTPIIFEIEIHLWNWNIKHLQRPTSKYQLSLWELLSDLRPWGACASTLPAPGPGFFLHPPLPQPSQNLHPLGAVGPWFPNYCLEKEEGHQEPCSSTGESAGLLQILHWCSSLKPAVLQVQNYCRCGSNSAWIGQPVPLKSTAFKRVHLRLCWELAGRCAACEWAQCLWFPSWLRPLRPVSVRSRSDQHRPWSGLKSW